MLIDSSPNSVSKYQSVIVVSFGGHQSFTVRILGDFPHFLSALPSNNQFIIKLVKMWPGGAPHVVVGTLKLSLDQLKKKN